MAKKQEVSKITGGEVIPAYLKKFAGEGTELVGDLAVVPRLKLLQALNPEVIDDGQPMGDFYHTVAELSLGSTLTMSPVFVSQSVLLWRPRKDGGGILARADDGMQWDRPNTDFTVKLDSGKTVVWNTGATVKRGGLTEFGTMDPADPNSYPAATRMINVIAMLPEHLDLSPCVISLQRSSFKVGQQFVSKLKISRLPSWSRVFTMDSVKDKNPKNESYRNWKFTPQVVKGKNGPRPVLIPEKDVDQYRGMYETFSQKGFEIRDEEELQGESSAINTESDVF
jgi:hypothetical protein